MTQRRQVIVNTHSPAVVAQVEEDDLLLVVPEVATCAGRRCVKPVFRWLEDTWRARERPNVSSLPTGLVLTYFNPVEPIGSQARRRRRRVVDRPERRRWLCPFQIREAEQHDCAGYERIPDTADEIGAWVAKLRGCRGRAMRDPWKMLVLAMVV